MKIYKNLMFSSIASYTNSFIKNKTGAALFLILLLSVLIRLIHFDASVTFGYDQARDAFQALEIFTKDPIKLLGPQTDFIGLHHGTLYWYLISPAYFLFDGDVNAARIFLIIINVITIFFIYNLSNLLFKNKKIALLAALFFALSFEQTQYARWMSNPSPAILTSTISFWSLKKLLDGKKWALATLLMSWLASVQFEIFMLYQILAFIIIWVFTKGFKLPKLTKRQYLFTLLFSSLSALPLILAEIKFGFKGVKVLTLFLSQSSNPRGSFTNALWTYVDRLINVFYLNLWGINLVLAGILGIITLFLAYNHIKSKRYRREVLLLVIWVVSPLFLHFFKGSDVQFQTLGAGIGIILLTSYLLISLSKRLNFKWLVPLALTVIVLGNLNLIFTYNKNGEVLFTSQDKLLLRDELATIDWVYQESGGNKFHLNTVTNPSLINTTWAYLFNWYGRKNYGYMPIWWGEPQVDVFGSEIEFAKEEETEYHFLIIEPDAGHATGIVRAVKYLEDTRSEILETREFGNFVVEKRKITNPKRIFNNQDIFYYLLQK